jgi:hypothetical protein
MLGREQPTSNESYREKALRPILVSVCPEWHQAKIEEETGSRIRTGCGFYIICSYCTNNRPVFIPICMKIVWEYA